jgi:hypothetical protein
MLLKVGVFSHAPSLDVVVASETSHEEITGDPQNASTPVIARHLVGIHSRKFPLFKIVIIASSNAHNFLRRIAR